MVFGLAGMHHLLAGLTAPVDDIVALSNTTDEAIAVVEIPSARQAPGLELQSQYNDSSAVLTTTSQRGMRLGVQLLDRLDQIVYGEPLSAAEMVKKESCAVKDLILQGCIHMQLCRLQT